MTAITDLMSFKQRRVSDLLVGRSRVIQDVRSAIASVSRTRASVLISGPSGSGKEVVAKALHQASLRKNKAFVSVNCGAIPADLLESELFGHERGAFTGALQRRTGRFEEAHEGTLFLDEIGDMPLEMQVKLLRVLEEKTCQRVGSNAEIPVDARIISATHRDLDVALDQGRFREDLYYRLAVFPIVLPSLAERPEDIMLLIEHFQAGMAAEDRIELDRSARAVAESYGWPGNVRELRNFVERALVLYPGKMLSADMVNQLMSLGRRREAVQVNGTPAKLSATAISSDELVPYGAIGGGPLPALEHGTHFDMPTVIENIERQYILDALDLADGVIAEASRLLGLQRTTLIGKMNKYQLARL